MSLLEISQHALPVVVPLPLDAARHRILAAAELDGDLEAVGEHVVEVLHPAADDVPLCAVGDAAGEVVRLADARAAVHEGVRAGVGLGQVLEGGVVGGPLKEKQHCKAMYNRLQWISVNRDSDKGDFRLIGI